MRIRTYNFEPDYIFIAAIFLLTVFGLMVLASASSDLGQKKFGDSYYYLKHQILYGLSLGLIGFFLALKIDYSRFERLAFWFLIASVILLMLVFTPLGFKAGGADRWVKFGPLTAQPAEIVKAAFLIYIAAWLSKKTERSRSFQSGFIPFLIVCGLVAGLLLAQPSTTTVALIAFSSLIVYFLSGAKMSYLLSAIFLGILILTLIIYSTPYRLKRVQAFLNPQADSQGTGFHINQALTAIGSGGLWGVGYGKSLTKYNYLPEPIGDSIFAVIGEEFGFAGAAGLVFFYFFLLYRVFRIAWKSRDNFAKLLSTGFGTIIGAQVFINIAAISGIIPLTGVPLPFISYGGTALAVFLTMAGITANISKYNTLR
ncbi:MAG: putative lipid II flippase FtsW [Candidatus Brennerbacteria bacterium]|nr:putative lipid II flippase FtsW [Candidatus Brennerbacteria bacterium]